MVIRNRPSVFGPAAEPNQPAGPTKRGFQASTWILLYSYPLSETSRERLKITVRLPKRHPANLRGGCGFSHQAVGLPNCIADMNEHKHLLYTANKVCVLLWRRMKSCRRRAAEALRILLYLFERDEAVKTYQQ